MALEPKGEAWVRALAQYRVLPNACGVEPPLGSGHAIMEQAWRKCSEHERQVLSQLAIDEYVNPHANNGPVVERLVRRGILDCQTLTFANPDFAEMIRLSVTSEQRRAWEASDKNENAWQAVRAPLLGLVVALFSAISLSKPELGAASAVVPTLAAGMPVVIQTLLQMLSPRAS